MTLQNQTQIDTALKDGCRRFIYSGYQMIAWSSSHVQEICGGVTSYWEKGEPVTADSLFDLGSLTKVILTTSVLARLLDRKALALTDSLSLYLPEFENTGYASISIGHLLSHSSGLIGWHPFFKEEKGDLVTLFKKRESVFIAGLPLSKTTYSDLGFLLLGELIKRQWGALNVLFEKEVLTPLKLKGIQFGPVTSNNVAATEYCLERRKLLHGEVFDFNTAAMGGVCAHAGLFASAKALLPWALEWLNAVQGKSTWLSQATAQQFTQPVKKVEGSTWSFGWDTKSKAFSSAGENFSIQSFGHLGFPGTSVWIDPQKKGLVLFLTNRVHPSRHDERIKRFRPLLHDLVAKAWGTDGV